MDIILRFLFSPGMLICLISVTVVSTIMFKLCDIFNISSMTVALSTTVILIIIITGLLLYDEQTLKETPIQISSYEVVDTNTIRYTTLNGELKEIMGEKVYVKQGKNDELLMTIIETKLFRIRQEIIIYEPAQDYGGEKE